MSREVNPYAVDRILTVRLSYSVWQVLRDAADRIGVTENTVIQTLIVKFADRMERE